MNTEVMKNMVVVKNLPSNMIEEALIILKPNLKVKELEAINIDKNGKEEEEATNSAYVIKEAELLVKEYISKIEKEEKTERDSKFEEKYKSMRKKAIISLFFSISCLIFSIMF